jgi:hypothetical protein
MSMIGLRVVEGAGGRLAPGSDGGWRGAGAGAGGGHDGVGGKMGETIQKCVVFVSGAIGPTVALMYSQSRVSAALLNYDILGDRLFNLVGGEE